MSRRSRVKHAWVLSWAVLGVSLPEPAQAQAGADSAAAQGLFDEARTLMDSGKAAEACPKFEESQRLDPGSGTLLNLAKCYEQVHRVASAWSTYLEAATAARSASNPQRETAARELAAALAPRVSRLVVDVPTEARPAGLEISRDGAIMGAAQWGLPIPADPGEHTIVAKAPGHKAWQTVAVVKAEGTTSRVTVPGLETEVTAPGRDTAEGSEKPATGLGTQRILAIVAGGVGVVGVGVGTVFGLKSKSNHDDAAKYCSGAVCTDPRGVAAGNDAHAAGNVSTVGMIIGVAGLAGGAALWFTAPRETAPVQVGMGPSGVQMRGVW